MLLPPGDPILMPSSTARITLTPGGVVHAARAAKFRIVGLLTIAVPTVATRASRSEYLEADTLVAVRSGRPGRGAVQRGRMVIDPVGELGSLWPEWSSDIGSARRCLRRIDDED